MSKQFGHPKGCNCLECGLAPQPASPVSATSMEPAKPNSGWEDISFAPASVPEAREGEPTIAVGLNGEYSTFTLKAAVPTHEGGEVVEAASKYAARVGFQYWTIVEAAGFAAEYARQLQERCGELAADLALAKGEAVRLRGLAEDAWKRAKKLDTLLVGTRSNLRHFRGKVEAAEQARKVAEDKVVELQTDQDDRLSPNIICGHSNSFRYATLGAPGGLPCMQCDRDAAQGMVATIQEALACYLYDGHFHGPESMRASKELAKLLKLSAPIAEAHDREVASKAIETLWVKVEGRASLPDSSTRVLMFVRGIGPRTGTVTSVFEMPWYVLDRDWKDGNRNLALEEVAFYINLDVISFKGIRARAQDFEDRKRDAGL